jgi:hypothetical protein
LARPAEARAEAAAPRLPFRAEIEALRAERGGMAWPDAWFESADSEDYRRCRALWAMCLAQRIIVACETALAAAGRRRAKTWPAEYGLPVPPHWLRGPEARAICDLAGVDHGALVAAVLPALACPEAARALRDRLAHVGRGEETWEVAA